MNNLISYIDAGTGSMILQLALGGAAGFVVMLKMFGRRMVSFLTFWDRGHADDEGAPQQSAQSADPKLGDS